MRRKFLAVWATLLAFLTAAPLLAQNPPDISRWTGNTAIAPAQGYSRGDPLTLTWGFAQEGINIPDGGAFDTSGAGPNDIRAWLNGLYGNQNTWEPLFQSMFDRWADISGLSYQFEANDDGATFVTSTGVLGVRPDIRIASKPIDGNSGVLAFNYFPGSGGDMVFDSNDNFYNDVSNNSLRLRNVASHEHGHGLGMAHVDPADGNFLMEPFINLGFDGPQHHDILIAQRGYGDALEKSNNGEGNDSFDMAVDQGTLENGDNFMIGDDARTFLVDAASTEFISIDDQSDTDFYSFTINEAGFVDILLEALGHTYDVGPQNGQTGPWSTLDRSDLQLAIFDTDGTTILASANLNGLGGNEELLAIELDEAGTYFIRVTGTDNQDNETIDTQFYALTTSFTAAIPEPNSILALTICGLGLAFRRRK